MYLKSLELQGFKSFPDKTVIRFGDDITAIVGPNGSGHSNISDAILWVMGEQSSKTLRGAKMEDVIFGGTAKRPQLGFAEATLTLDNSDRALAYDADEVVVTRRYYRSGDGEYYINRQSARLKDINELLMDTGLGREGYSNIGQGRIDEILSLKSGDRREIFEEAAGISKYRHRKEETERQLERTEDNLMRIGDKVSELELQLEPLKLQSEKAQRYLEMKEELKGVEVAVWLDTLDKLSAAAKKAEEDYASASFVLQQAHDDLDGLYRQAEELGGALREKDAALERRFQPVYIGEPSVSETTEILKGIRSYYETFHGVTVSDEMCRRAAEMSERYITDRFLPDKAIDLIDEACSRLNLDSPQLSEIPELQNELERLQAQLDELTQSSARSEEEETYAKIASCRSRILQVEAQLHDLLCKPAPAVDEQLLAEVIEIWTGIPASKVAAQESARLRDMENRLKSHVIGQDEAVDAVCASIRRSRAGISPKRKPASFLFVGPTGVGKTELVKQLALDLFDSPDALVRLDMSEYMEKHTVSRLIGSPPGYVGYDEAGQLTEKIRRRPYSVVLFDEIEKAHPDVLNSLLQILDDGRLTDAQGRVVSFENTVIVMTSNAGSQSSSTPAGFGRTVSQMSKDRVMKALEEIMRPEFLNRIDEIIAFNQLTEDNFDTLGDMVQPCLTDPKYAQGRAAARAHARVYPGEGAVRAADYLEQKVKELTATHEEKEP